MPSKKELLKELKAAHAEIDKLTDCIGLMEDDIHEAFNLISSTQFWLIKEQYCVAPKIEMLGILERASKRFSDFKKVPF